MIRISLLALALCSFGTACGDDGGDDGNVVDCDTSTLTYANFGEQFMESQCQSCHGSTVTGGERSGAPVAVTFDDIGLVQNQAGRIKSRVSAGSMPPSSASSTPSQAERNDLVEWIDCGAP